MKMQNRGCLWPAVYLGGPADSGWFLQEDLPAAPRDSSLLPAKEHGVSIAVLYESTCVLHCKGTQSQDKMFPALHGADGSTGTGTARIQPAQLQEGLMA